MTVEQKARVLAEAVRLSANELAAHLEREVRSHGAWSRPGPVPIGNRFIVAPY